MHQQRPDSELLLILNKLHVVWVSLSPSAMKAVKVVVPDEGERGDNDCWQNKETNGQAKQVVSLVEGTGGVQIYHPDVHKELDDVSDDGEGPRHDLPAGGQAGGDGGGVSR